MGLQSIIEKSEFTNFLQCGAILQLEPDKFKLIWGPFHDLTINIEELEDEITVIYKPDFWDFISLTQIPAATVVGAQERILTRNELLQCLEMLTSAKPSIQWAEPTAMQFQKQFEWSQNEFNSNELLKTVPIIYQVGHAAYTISHLIYSLANVLKGHHYGSLYGYWSRGHGYLGQTPERIIHWDYKAKIALTMALAGTLPNEMEANDRIQHDQKISKEHAIVVEDLKSAVLKIRATGSVVIQKRETLQLKYLIHLLTPILIQETEFKDTIRLTQAIHPSAALGLYPRSIKKFEQWYQFQIQKERKNFAAPFGFFQKSGVDVVAAIRSFYFTPTSVQIYSGCGVTSESDLAAELLELQAKRNSVKKMMGLNE